MKYLFIAVVLTGCAHNAPKPPKAVYVPVPTAKPFTSFTIRFGFDSANVLKWYADRLPGICRKVNAQGTPLVVTGYASADRSGKYADTASKVWNQVLSESRAGAVVSALRASGCVTPVQSIAAGEKRGIKNRKAVIEAR